MNKKILAAVVAAAVFGPVAAYADPAGVTLYGKFDADFDLTGTTDSKAVSQANSGAAIKSAVSNQPTRANIRSSSSNFGIKGKEELMDGLSAFFQVESSIPINGSVAPTSATGAPISGTVGTIASRNTGVGLSGSWGQVLLGIWDTPYKQATQPLSITFADAMVWDYTTILSGNATPTTANGVNRNVFDRRQENSVQYWSPNFNGLTLKAVYSVDNTRPASNAAVSNLNPALYGLSAIYDANGLVGSLSYERHIDYAATPSSDYGVKASIGYTFPTATSVGLIAERLNFNGNIASGTAATAAGVTTITGFANNVSNVKVAQTVAQQQQLLSATEAKISSYYLTLKQGVGEHGTIRASYGFDTGLQLNSGDLNSSRARAAVIGYSYNLSKRTDLYAMYLQLNNDDNSKNDVGGSQASTGVTAGASVRSLGAGIRHTF